MIFDLLHSIHTLADLLFLQVEGWHHPLLFVKAHLGRSAS